MGWMRSWRRRVVARRPHLKPPARPAERLEEARQAAREAEAVLVQVQRLEPVVQERAEVASRIHQENNLGPSFWKAVEGRHP